MTASTLPRPLTEAAFQSAVIALARSLGWGISQTAWTRQGEELATYDPAAVNQLDGLIFHPRFSVGSESGWPDLVMARRKDRRLIFVELKSEKGRLSARQEAVLDLLRAVGAQVYVWRPSQLDELVEVLR